jgi:hypothetical protein
MNLSEVSISTVTLVRRDDEERLLRASLERLSRAGLKVAVSDGGSRCEFIDFLHTLESFTVVPPAASGLVGQVQASVRTAAAWHTPFILYTEPDKRTFFDGRLADFVASAPADASIGVVLAGRDEASFSTFPAFQQRTEGAFNAICSDLLGERGDYCYGPFLMNRVLVAELSGVKGDLGWGWRPFMFARARRGGLRVLHHVCDLPCPADQARDEDESDRIHRLRQLRQNVEGLITSCTGC